MHISQPALSAQIKALEDELGVALFDRTSSGMQLTVGGRQLLAEAEKVLAAAQSGRHEAGRDTYGHSIVVSPWGEVLAEAGVEPGIIIADLKLGEIAEARQRIPSLQHDRDFSVVRAALPAPAMA